MGGKELLEGAAFVHDLDDPGEPLRLASGQDRPNAIERWVINLLSCLTCLWAVKGVEAEQLDGRELHGGANTRKQEQFCAICSAVHEVRKAALLDAEVLGCVGDAAPAALDDQDFHDVAKDVVEVGARHALGRAAVLSWNGNRDPPNFPLLLC